MKKALTILTLLTLIAIAIGHCGTAVQSELAVSADRVSGYMAADQ